MSLRKRPLPVLQPGACQEETPVPEYGGEPSPGRTERTVLRVGGMDCASCAATVERRVGRLPEVRRAVVNFAAGRLDAEHAPGLDSVEIEQAVESAGYAVIRDQRAETASLWRTPRVFSMLGAALLLLAAFGLDLSGLAWPPVVAVYLTAVLVGGVPIFRAALSALRSRHLDMNVLMSAAVVGAAGIGAWGEAALVVVLFAAGNALQSYAVDRTRGAVRALVRLAPEEVTVRREGVEQAVPAGEVRVGDRVVVRPGERLAVDGEVEEGESTVDEAPVTGESVPVEKVPGDPVFSGSLNGSGGFVLRAAREAEDSTLQKISRSVDEAQAGKAPAEQFVDRFSRVYTPLVVGLAATLAVVPPLLGGDFGTWLYRSLALLIIACPCSLVISTPVTVVSGLGAASRRGVLVKGGAALEASGGIRTLVLDKTGTLTEGRPVLVRTVALDGTTEEEALRLAGALERFSEHPLAHAMLTAAGGLDLPPVEGFRAITGRGAEGVVLGRRYLVGSPRLFAERGISLESASPVLAEVARAGETPVVLGDEGGPVAVFGLADSLRPDAVSAVRTLREAGVDRLVMLTGDAEAPARRVAGDLGIEYQAGLLPEEKAAAVRGLDAEHGPVGMVGDGINDAPALAAAHVSFAMGAAGTGVALETADVALVKDDLAGLARAVRLSRSAGRVVRQNILASILIKGVFVILAPLGFVTLPLAVLADMGTSIGVTLNGLRLFGRSGEE